MKVSWAPPDVDGGTSIIEYQLEYKKKTSAVWITVSCNKFTDTTTVAKGLEENTEYEFRVYAENAVGVSDVSTASEAYRTLGTFYASKIIQFIYKSNQLHIVLVIRYLLILLLCLFFLPR